MASPCLHLSSTPELRRMLNAALGESLGTASESVESTEKAPASEIAAPQIADRTVASDADAQNRSAPSDFSEKFQISPPFSVLFRQYASTRDGDAIPYAVVGAAWRALRQQRLNSTSDSGPGGNRSTLSNDKATTKDTSTIDNSKPANSDTNGSTAPSTNTSDIVTSGNGKSSDWPLLEVLKGCHVLLPAPPEPPKKSAELEARLAVLQEAEEQRRYKELVRDVLPGRRGGKRGTASARVGDGDDDDDGGQGGSSYLASYREQLGFGMHVVGVMFTCYLVGHYAASALIKHQPALHPVGGVVGLIFGMMLETTLFIIRTTQLEKKQERQRSRKATGRHGAAFHAAPRESEATEDLSTDSKKGDASLQEVIELAGRRQKGGSSAIAESSAIRRRTVRQSS